MLGKDEEKRLNYLLTCKGNFWKKPKRTAGYCRNPAGNNSGELVFLQ